MTEWRIVCMGQHIGPLSTEAVRDALSRGPMDRSSGACRVGAEADLRPLYSWPEFRDLDPGPPPTGPGNVAAAVRSVLYAIGGAMAGAAAGMFYPLFSGPLALNVCQPWSPCREQTATSYGVAGATLGFLLGLVSVLLERSSAR